MRFSSAPATQQRAIPGCVRTGGPLLAILPILVVARVALFALHPLDDPDTWWHLAAGRWIARHWAIPHTDTLSFTVRDHPWINLQWSFDLLLYGLYQIGGTALLVLTGAFSYGLVIALLIRNLRLALAPLGSSLMALWVTLPLLERLKVRPEMASFVLLEALLWAFASGNHADRRRLWLLPVLMIIWVNTHALFTVGVFIIVCHMVSIVVTRLFSLGWRDPAALGQGAVWPTLLGGAAAVLLTVANPYLLQGVAFPITLLSTLANPVFRNIGEFHPPFSQYHVSFTVRAYQAFFVLSVVVVLLAYVITVGSKIRYGSVGGKRRATQRDREFTTSTVVNGVDKGRLDIAGLLIYGGLAYLSLQARRNMALFALGVAPFVGQCMVVVKARLPRAVRTAGGVATPPLTALISLALIGSMWFLPPSKCWSGAWESNSPIRASAFVKRMRLPPRLFNDLSSGGYLTWDAPSEEGVYIDGRLEVYGPEFFASYSAALSDPVRWQREADRLGIRTVLLLHRPTNYQPLIRWLLTDARWTLVYFDDVAVVFIRRADNEELISESHRQFFAVNDQATKGLLGPLSPSQCHEEKAEALSGYAGVLALMGNTEQAMRYYARALDFSPSTSSEMDVRLHLADLNAVKGDLAAARDHLRRAARLDPSNPALLELRKRIGP